MASPVFTLLTTTLKQAFAENTNLNTSIYCSNNAVTVSNTAKSSKIQSTVHQMLKFETYLQASQSAIRPGSASATALEFLHNKGNRIGFTKLLFQRTFVYCTMVPPFILY